jgi:DNA replication protein DnaC
MPSTQSYGEWRSILAIASAILDPLLSHVTTITTRGASYHLKEKRRTGIFQQRDTVDKPA